MARRAKAAERIGGAGLKVRKNRRVALHYRLCLASGVEIDASQPDSPMEIVCGRGETILGLEKRILGMESGDHRAFIIPPEEAFGLPDDSLRRTLPIESVEANGDLSVGDRIPLSEKGTSFVGRVLKINNSEVVADFNHPLAGESLHYEINVLTVSEVQPDMLSN